MSRVEYRCLITGLEVGSTGNKISLLAFSSSNSSTSLNGRLIESTSLHLGSTVAKITLGGFHESSTGFNFMVDIVTWMSRDAGRQHGCNGDKGKTLHFGNGSGSMRVSG